MSHAIDLVTVLNTAVQMGASDIHLAAGSPPLTRVGGEITELPGFPMMSSEMCKALVYSALQEDQRALFETGLELDCSIFVPKLGMYSLDKSLEELVRRGIVDLEEASARAHNPARLTALGAHRAVASAVLS